MRPVPEKDLFGQRFLLSEKAVYNSRVPVNGNVREKMNAFALKGHVLHTPTPTAFACLTSHFLVCENGCVAGVFAQLPQKYAGIKVEDVGDRLLVPGLVDLHVHAPQYAFRGLGMDRELLEWLREYTFPEEARYADLAYAGKAYRLFVDDLKRSPTTRACIFATLHVEATLLLMQWLDETGLVVQVGKVNMDRNSPADYVETTAASLSETERWIRQSAGFRRVSPILTPRFAPACSADLMTSLGHLQRAYGLPVQSHLSENPGEVAWVRSLFPDSACYAAVYDRFGLFGSNGPTVMAHGVYATEAEMALMRERGVFLAHCPQSNVNLASGIAPVRKYLEMGVPVGLGSDIAGGASLSGFRAMADALSVSKLYWRLVDSECRPLTFPEVFYMATKGGGAFFGQTGSFETGYAFDVLVLDDTHWPVPKRLDPLRRLERLVHIGDERCVRQKYVQGRKVFG